MCLLVLQVDSTQQTAEKSTEQIEGEEKTTEEKEESDGTEKQDEQEKGGCFHRQS
jgi:hypothetical protein